MKHAFFVFIATAVFIVAPIAASVVKAAENQPAATSAASTAAADAFAQGKAKLAAGQFKEALAAFKTASEGDAQNKSYAKAFASLEKAISFQEKLPAETDAQKWIGIARALHVYYHQNSAFVAAKELDEKINRKYQNTISALLLAQSLLALNENAQAVELLAKLPPKNQNVETQSLRAIALYREGTKEEALKLAKSISFSKNPCAGKSFSYAKLHAALELNDEAAKYLRSAFEQAPPACLDAFKEAAKQNPDLGKLLANPKYADLLAVQSKPGAEHHEEGEAHNDADSAPRHQCLDCPNQKKLDADSDEKKSDEKSEKAETKSPSK